MITFKEHYYGFLGIKKNDMHEKHLVVESEFRDRPLNQKYFYPIIISDYDKYGICSCSHRFIDFCRETFDGSFESIKKIQYGLSTKETSYRLRKMRRYTIENMNRFYKTESEILTREIIRDVEFRAAVDKEQYILKKSIILAEKRQFALLRNNRIVATAFISDIYNKGCNIAVYTDPEYRCNGYGKEVVKACINWCMHNKLLPIYLVEEDNKNSIRLAESVGFEQKSTEWIIS